MIPDRVSGAANRRVLTVICVLAVLLRLGAALYFGDTVPPKSDELSYSTLAARLVEGHGYSFPTGWYPFTPPDTPTAHWSFLYTAFVAAVYAIFGPHPLAARLVQAVLAGILLPWLTYRLTRRLQVEGLKVEGYGLAADSKPVGRTAATTSKPLIYQPSTVPLLAAFLSAVYAYFILYSAYVQTEAFFICALLWSLERALALIQSLRNLQPADFQPSTFNVTTSLGISLGIATLLRQSILPWIAIMYLYILWKTWTLKDRYQRKSGPTFGWHVISVISVPLCVVLFVAPFTLRNYRVYDSFLLLNSNAGYAMYAAQHPMHGTSFQEYAAAPLPTDIDPATMNEATWDKALMRRGIGFVLADPGRYLLLSLSRVRDFIEFWPTPDSSLLFNLGRVFSIGILLPFMLYGIAIANCRLKKEEGRFHPRVRHQPIFHFPSSIFLLSFIAFYSLLHIATWAMPRYRLPVDAVALPFAALALWTLAQRLRRKA